jgi:pimeloyl-ACP methyl ester carboxylesterase
MHGWAPAVIEAVGGRVPNPAGYLSVFYSPSDASRAAGVEALGWMTATVTRYAHQLADARARYDAVCAWGTPDHGLLQRVAAIEMPVFVANGDGDPMSRPRYSHLLAGLVTDARLQLYPDSAHGFLFQHHAEFAGDVARFLASA